MRKDTEYEEPEHAAGNGILNRRVFLERAVLTGGLRIGGPVARICKPAVAEQQQSLDHTPRRSPWGLDPLAIVRRRRPGQVRESAVAPVGQQARKQSCSHDGRE